jgi:hypothetical protein
MKPLIIAHDTQTNRNVEAVLGFYDEMINKKQAIQATEKYLVPDCISGSPEIDNALDQWTLDNAPARNHELINWLLENGFQIGWPANLMTIGPYQEPLTPFLPSLAY